MEKKSNFDFTYTPEEVVALVQRFIRGDYMSAPVIIWDAFRDLSKGQRIEEYPDIHGVRGI